MFLIYTRINAEFYKNLNDSHFMCQNWYIKITIKWYNKPGVVLNGADGTMGVRGQVGANASIPAAKGADELTGTGAGQDRIVYKRKDAAGNAVKETVATMNDGLHFTGDNGNTVIDKALKHVNA